MSKLTFYLDENGLPAAEGSDRRLATFLQTDIQGSAEVAKSIIAAITDPDYRGEITGNAHSLSVTKKMAIIESLYDDEMPARTLPRAEFLATMKRWLTFIQ